MANLNKVRIQLLDENTGAVLEDVDVLTSAEAVTFEDGKKLSEVIPEVTTQLAETTADISSRGLSPLTFNVIGDGITDDTTALQSYINYCQTNNLLMAINGTFAVTGITFGSNARVTGNSTFKAFKDDQPFVIRLTSKIIWNGRLFIDGDNKALNGFTGANFISSHIGEVEVRGCKKWGFNFERSGNNGLVQVDFFRGASNGTKHTTAFSVMSNIPNGAYKMVTITITNALASKYYSDLYDVIFVLYNGRPYKVNRFLSDTSLEIYNIPLAEGSTGTVDIIIGGALNIQSYGDNGVGNWGALDIFSNNGIGLNMSSLYGHTFGRLVLQGNSIGVGCSDISLGVVFNSPYFELNGVDIVVWNYIVGTMFDPIISYDKIFSLVQHNLYGYDYNRSLNIVGVDKSPNMSSEISIANPANKTLYPSKHYAFSYNVNQTAKTFTIKNDVLYTNSLSNYIYMTLQVDGGLALTFNLSNANGETVQGSSSYVVNASGKVHVIISKIDKDWKVTVLKEPLIRATIPTSGTFKIGDYVEKLPLVEAGVAGNKYIIYGWKRLTNGNTHILNIDWFEDRRSTGN